MSFFLSFFFSFFVCSFVCFLFVLLFFFCKNFNGYINGTGSLNITDVDVNDGMGYLVNVRVENEGAISYYIQYVQSVDGSPPIVEIE
jgi:hypothetical protein